MQHIPFKLIIAILSIALIVGACFGVHSAFAALLPDVHPVAVQAVAV